MRVVSGLTAQVSKLLFKGEVDGGEVEIVDAAREDGQARRAWATLEHVT